MKRNKLILLIFLILMGGGLWLFSTLRKKPLTPREFSSLGQCPRIDGKPVIYETIYWQKVTGDLPQLDGEFYWEGRITWDTSQAGDHRFEFQRETSTDSNWHTRESVVVEAILLPDCHWEIKNSQTLDGKKQEFIQIMLQNLSWENRTDSSWHVTEHDQWGDYLGAYQWITSDHLKKTKNSYLPGSSPSLPYKTVINSSETHYFGWAQSPFATEIRGTENITLVWQSSAQIHYERSFYMGPDKSQNRPKREISQPKAPEKPVLSVKTVSALVQFLKANGDSDEVLQACATQLPLLLNQNPHALEELWDILRDKNTSPALISRMIYLIFRSDCPPCEAGLLSLLEEKEDTEFRSLVIQQIATEKKVSESIQKRFWEICQESLTDQGDDIPLGGSCIGLGRWENQATLNSGLESPYKELLKNTLHSSPNENSLFLALNCASMVSDLEIRETVETLTEHASPVLRKEAYEILILGPSSQKIPLMKKIQGDSDSEVREAFFQSLSQQKDIPWNSEELEALDEFWHQEKNPQVRSAIVACLGKRITQEEAKAKLRTWIKKETVTSVLWEFGKYLKSHEL